MTTTDMLDLDEELPRRERRRLVTPVGVGAAAIAIAAAGFFGGVQVQKSRGDSGGGGGFAGARQGGLGGAGGGQRGAAGAAPAGGASAGGGATPGSGAGPGGGQAQAGGATVGQVASINGSTLYVDDASGTTIKVKLAKGGTVNRTAKAKASEIHPGDTVVVQGETASSGTVVASTIRATSSTAGGFGGFGG